MGLRGAGCQGEAVWERVYPYGGHILWKLQTEALCHGPWTTPRQPPQGNSELAEQRPVCQAEDFRDRDWQRCGEAEGRPGIHRECDRRPAEPYSVGQHTSTGPGGNQAFHRPSGVHRVHPYPPRCGACWGVLPDWLQHERAGPVLLS